MILNLIFTVYALLTFVYKNIFLGKYGILQNGDLYIRDTSEHDSSYSFRCHTENTVTREKKVSTNYSKLIVTGE